MATTPQTNITTITTTTVVSVANTTKARTSVATTTSAVDTTTEATEVAVETTSVVELVVATTVSSASNPKDTSRCSISNRDLPSSRWTCLPCQCLCPTSKSFFPWSRSPTSTWTSSRVFRIPPSSRTWSVTRFTRQLWVLSVKISPARSLEWSLKRRLLTSSFLCPIWPTSTGISARLISSLAVSSTRWFLSE